ncbi:hypothetical protein BBJ28_00026154 [Nothophytophthora sp. Chile5]|nr:hypothetical protein BBJ28_00026154 [Nothophytophthora sp. Chile5]
MVNQVVETRRWYQDESDPRFMDLFTTPPPVSRAAPARDLPADPGCPPMRFFKMRKQVKKEYWQFIVLVADEAFADIPDDMLRTEHAKHGWCLRCEEVVKVSKGKHRAGEHMNESHPNELLAFRQQAEARRVQEASQMLTNVYTQHCPIPVFEGPAQSVDQRQADDLLAKWVASSLRPASIVEDPGFLNYVKFVNSVSKEVRIPSRQTVTTRIRSNAAELRASLSLRLAAKSECDYFSASSDIWTSMTAESYMSLTLHYVDENFNMNGWTLEVVSLPGKHDALSIGSALVSIFERWGLNRDKCTRFLRDGASNMKKACDDIGLRNLSCAAHSLHLVVAAALMRKSGESTDVSWMDAASQNEGDIGDEDSDDDDNEIDEAISGEEINAICAEVAAFVQPTTASRAELELVRVTVARFRKLAMYFRRSSKGANRLKILQKDSTRPLKVLADSPTRWGSTLAMLQRLIELRPALDEFFIFLTGREGADEFRDMKNKLDRPTSEEWLVIQCLVELLGPFSAASEELSGDRYPTLVALFPGIRSLRDELKENGIFRSLFAAVQGESFSPRVEATMESVRWSFVHLLEKRFEVLDEELLWISLLDPRFTNTPLLTADETSKASKFFVDAMFSASKVSANFNAEIHTPSPEKKKDGPTPKKVKVSYRRRLYGSRMSIRAEDSLDDDDKLLEECKWEFNKYMRESALVKATTEPLTWWRDNQRSFQHIAPLARKWLGCIATSVPSERAFSTAGNTITKRRSALKASTVRDLIFIAENPTA